MSGWILRGRAKASATALFGPWPYSSFVRRSLRPLPHCRWSGLQLRMGALIIFVRYRRGSSSPSVVATGSVLDLPHLLRLGMGRAQSEIAFFTPTTVSSQWQLRRCRTGKMATAARRMVATSEGGGRPCRRSRPLRRWLLHKLIHNKTSLIQSVAVHAVLGGGAPR
jgi:hypothetical protein